MKLKFQTQWYVIQLLQTPVHNARYSVQSSELAINDNDDKQDKNGYDGNGDDAVGGHAAWVVSKRVE
jgi:hypothetical protein